VIKTDTMGAGLVGWINELNNDYTLEKNVDHVVMIYDGFRLNTKQPRKRAKPIAFGILKLVIS